jgi:hypothetical protein
MPVVTSSDRLTTKSTLRHRPIHPRIKLEEPPRVPRASRTQTQKPSASRTAPVDVPVWKPGGKQQTQWRQRLLLVGMGFGMLLAVTLVVLGQLAC